MSRPAWQHVMMHHSAGGDSAGVEREAYRRWHVEGRGWADIGYHFVVEQVDDAVQVLMGRPLYMSGAHCPGYNGTAIGVCLAGNFEAAPPSGALLAAAARQVAGLCFSLSIPTSEILQHRDHRRTDCPGKHFDLDDFRRRVAALLE